MILHAKFETTDTMPPAVWRQLARAINSLFANYGVEVHVREDREAELAMHTRYWEWAREERDKRDLWPTPEHPDV